MAVETGSVAMVQALLTTPSINLGILNKVKREREREYQEMYGFLRVYNSSILVC